MKDEAGESIQGATVTLTDMSGQKAKVLTNENGRFLIPVRPGTYSVTCEYTRHKGWQKFFLKSFDVGDKSKLTLDITLTSDPNLVKTSGLEVPGEVVEPTASKLLELSHVTKATVDEKLIPLWRTISCDELLEIFVINYGSAAEIRRRAKLTLESWGFKCEFSQFRGFVLVDGDNAKPRTVIWRVPKRATPPKP